MKVLMVGPYPPPHGGISVHVLAARQMLEQAGLHCRVLNTASHGAKSGSARNWMGVLWAVARHARQAWTIHVHTNGHNWKSWFVAAICGLAANSRGGSVLTLHSGLLPSYLSGATGWQMALARFACSRYTRVVCVSPEILQSISSLGVSRRRADILPAYLGTTARQAPLRHDLTEWLGAHSPVLSTALFYRPEYGFDLLMTAVLRLRAKFPRLGCIVMGSGEDRLEAERLIQKSGLGDAVLLMGDVPHDVCLALISQSDVFVRPTLCDGDSVSVREALSLGVPVVASATGQRPEAAVLFDSGSADALTAKLESTLSQRPQVVSELSDSAGRLLEIYRRASGSSAQHAAA